jgi:hypothetical protein
VSWWRASRRAVALAVAVLAELALVAALEGELVPVPSLLQGSVTKVPAVVFLPLVVTMVAMLCLEGPDRAVESTSVRPVRAFDAALLLAVVIVLAAGGGAAHAAGADLALEGARNAVGYLGLGLIAAAYLDPRWGSLLPTAYVVLLVTFAPRDPTESAVLLWPLQDAGSVAAASVAAGAFVAGLLAISRPRLEGLRPRPRARGSSAR